MSQSVKVAVIRNAANVIAAWPCVHNEPEQVSARGLSSETRETFDDTLVRRAVDQR
jgi:hypothetical protein